MAITALTVPSVIKDNCEIYSGESGISNIRMHIYKWSGTDRVSIIWEKKNKNSFKAIGKMELHYKELFSSIGEIMKNREYLTDVMNENDWGLLDLRDMNAVREFDGDFF